MNPNLVQQEMEDLIVNLEDRSYPISFGSLENVGDAISKVHKKCKCVVVTNDVVGPIYGQKCIDALRRSGWNASYIEIPDGEEKKTAQTYVNLVDKLLDEQVDRKSLIVALGGGVTTDIVGFAAATTLRGVNFINIPTTLLAQVDASVGGKTGVNTKHGKNLLGAFWQPLLVYIPIETLSTLSDPEFRCGLGEVVKHAVLEQMPDPNKPGAFIPQTDFLEWLEENGDKIVRRDSECLQYAIRKCCEIKATIVSADEREAGCRALLNLGHTVGHAIEAVMGYGQLRHGEAVAIGTLAEAQLACQRGLCGEDVVNRIGRLLQKLGLPTGIKDLDSKALVEASLMDKKREDTEIVVTLVAAIGDVRLIKLKPTELIPVYDLLTSNITKQF